MKIYKYLIETPGSTHIMDHLTDIVSTGLDVNNNPCVWAVYDEKVPKKYFQINFNPNLKIFAQFYTPLNRLKLSSNKSNSINNLPLGIIFYIGNLLLIHSSKN